MLFTGANVAGRDAQNSISIDQKLNLDSRHACRLRWNLKGEMSEAAIVGYQFALALQDMNINSRLIIDGGRVHLACAGRNSRVPQNDLAHYTADCLNAETERRDIQQEHVF